MSSTIEQVVAQRTPELMRIDGVTGVGQALCDDTPCIRVYVVSESARARVPPRLDGFEVSTIVTGVITPRTVD